MLGSSWVVAQLAASQEGLSFMNEQERSCFVTDHISLLYADAVMAIVSSRLIYVSFVFLFNTFPTVLHI
jgi:hypothetical protein